jgi:hypothetical protein
MNNNRTISRILVMVSFCFSVSPSVLAQQQLDSLKVDLRIMPDNHAYIFRCSATNASLSDIAIPLAAGFMHDDSSFIVSELNDKHRQRVSMGDHNSYAEDDFPDPLLIAANSVYNEYVQKNTFIDYGARNFIGNYVSLAWGVGKLSNPIVAAFSDPAGNIAPPVVDPRDPTAKPILAFVFNENQTNELGFVFLNGSNETVTVEKPLTQASRIVATAPAIEYTKELFIAGQPSENIAIEAGKVGEWRIPWQTIHDLIPAADLTAIKAAGGDLDLVWKVGDFQSDPLPLSLSDPPGDSN